MINLTITGVKNAIDFEGYSKNVEWYLKSKYV